MKTNYSIQTSLPAYTDNKAGKQLQKEQFLSIMRDLGRDTTLLELSQITGLPQSTVSGRINDLIKDDLVKYDGYCEYEERKRNRIVLIQTEPVQGELFVTKRIGA